LGTHPDVVNVGHMIGPGASFKKLPNCSCRKQHDKCQFWKNVEKELNKLGEPKNLYFGLHFNSILEKRTVFNRLIVGGLIFDRIERLRNSIVKNYSKYYEEIKRIKKRNIRYIEAIKKVSNKNIIIDSSKDILRLQYLMEIPFLDIKVVHLVREPQGAVSSSLRRAKKRNKGSKSLVWTTLRWLLYEKKIEKKILNKIKRKNQYTVIYEDLCGNPLLVLDEIADQFGIKKGKFTTDYNPRNQHIYGNAIRIREPEKVKRDMRWEKEFNQLQISTIDFISSRYYNKCKRKEIVLD